MDKYYTVDKLWNNSICKIDKLVVDQLRVDQILL